MVEDRDITRQEMLGMLAWQQAAGADIAVSDTPIDRFAASAAKGPAQLPPQNTSAASVPSGGADTPTSPAAGQVAAPPDGGDGARLALDLAQGAMTMDALRAAMDGFEGSPLKLRATQLVFADGNPQADIMLIGEAPGRDEDLQGKPFVGRSGQLLDRMLAAIGLDRTRVFIANTVPWRPPGNRTPTPAEIAVCLPFLYRQIELCAPRVLVTLGAPATQTMLGHPVSITKVRGRWHDLSIGARTIPALPTFHPAYLLRQPAQKRLAWRDMLALKQAVDAF